MSTDTIRDIPVADDTDDSWGSTAEKRIEEGTDLGHPGVGTDTEDTPESPPRRDNWFGDNEEDDPADSEDDTSNVEYHDSTRRQDKAQHVAVKMLSGVVPALCGESWSGEERVVEELTDPGYFPVGEGFMDHVENARVNEVDGYISQGESTWVLYHGSPTEEFVFIIEVWLDYAVSQGVINNSLADDLLSDAKSMKQGTDKTDQRIVELLAIDMQKGERSTPGS